MVKQRARGRAPVQFRLPSEAEWEYACRAGWYDGNSGEKLRPVGEKEPRGGRKLAECSYADMGAVFLDVVAKHTAGHPTDGEAQWTQLGDEEMREHLPARGYGVGLAAVKRLLKKHHDPRRSAAKTKTFKRDSDRKSSLAKVRLWMRRKPMDSIPFSVSTRKKEYLGRQSPAGQVSVKEGAATGYDQSFPRYATGVVVPPGLYGDARSIGAVALGTRKDTSEFACARIAAWGSGNWCGSLPGPIN